MAREQPERSAARRAADRCVVPAALCTYPHTMAGSDQDAGSWNESWDDSPCVLSAPSPHRDANSTRRRVSTSASPPEPHKPTPAVTYPPRSRSAAQYELPDDLAEWAPPRRRWQRQSYEEGDTIDWWSEDARERARWKALFDARGLRGVLAPLLDASKIWFVVVCTGIGVGFAGGWLDVLVKWCVVLTFIPRAEDDNMWLG
jgi:hypothetical protein